MLGLGLNDTFGGSTTVNQPVTSLEIDSAIDDGSGTTFDLLISYLRPTGYTYVYGTVRVEVNSVTVYGPTAMDLTPELIGIDTIPGSPTDVVDVFVIVTGATFADGVPSSEVTNTGVVT